jgi:integrating conjugative element protein (TIGR03761 family)
VANNGAGNDLNGAARSKETAAAIPLSEQQSLVRLAIHTRDARKLIHGRPGDAAKPAIVGLFGFAFRLKSVWQSAIDADPYAVWWLLRVEEAYASSVAKIELERAATYEELRSALDFDVELGNSEFLLQVELNFACPYAYWGAKILKNFDHLVLAAEAAERLGLRRRSGRADNRFRCERSIRALFASPQGYRSFGIKPIDIKNSTLAAQAARASMGEIPTSILSGENRPALLPADCTLITKAVR